jgi:hypothetical protein
LNIRVYRAGLRIEVVEKIEKLRAQLDPHALPEWSKYSCDATVIVFEEPVGRQ